MMEVLWRKRTSTWFKIKTFKDTDNTKIETRIDFFLEEENIEQQ